VCFVEPCGLLQAGCRLDRRQSSPVVCEAAHPGDEVRVDSPRRGRSRGLLPRLLLVAVLLLLLIDITRRRGVLGRNCARRRRRLMGVLCQDL